MKIKTISIIFFLFLNFTSFGQVYKKIDSLKANLLNYKLNDTIKISNYFSLGSEYFTVEIDTALYFTKKALELSLTNDDYGLVKIYANLGLLYSEKLDNDSTRYYYDKALDILDVHDDKVLRSTIYGNYSQLYDRLNNLEKKLSYNLKAIGLVKGNDAELSFLYLNHSVFYKDAGFVEQSKKYLRLAYLSSIRAKEYRIESVSLTQLADDCINEKKYDSALIYLQKNKQLCEIINSPETYFYQNAVLGKLYDEMKMYLIAHKAHLKTLKNAIKLQQKNKIMLSYMSLGKHELKKGNYKKSSLYFNKFESLYKKNNDYYLGALAFKSWAKTESELKNYKKSNMLMLKYINIQDSIYAIKNRNLLANADTKYQTAKKDQEIAEQNLKIEEQQTQNNYIKGIALFLLLSSILTWLFFKQRQKRKNQEIVTLKREHQIKTLETLIEGEEKERFRIAKELHDGVNGDLSAIKYKLSTLLETNNSVIKEAIMMIDSSCDHVRAISHNLVPPSLDSFSLVEAVEEYCHKLDDLHFEKINFQHLGDEIVKLSKKEEINSYRIVQELVSNSLKHAKAANIDVQLSCRNNVLQITVEDNGIGFDRTIKNNEGIGLDNIQSRIAYLHATVDFISNKEGTSYTIEIDKNM